MAQFIELTGPGQYLEHALRLQSRGLLIDAAFYAALAAQMSGSAAFFEANALCAALAAKLGKIQSALAYWDKIIISAPQKLKWLEAAIIYALGKPEAEKYLAKWQKLLANVYISTPSVSILSALDKNRHGCVGSVGIHAGHLKGWLWQGQGKPIYLKVDGITNYQIAFNPKAVLDGKVLYAINEELPRQFGIISIMDAGQKHLQGSPVICSPPALNKGRDAQEITIIIPVYDDYEATLSCIGSVIASLKANKTKTNILVAWDRGPNAKLLARLRCLAAKGKIKLLENACNLGFLASVNNAIAETKKGDVLLLNADTLVHGNWIDRFVEGAKGQNVGTITALSNEAELMSYPSARDRGKVKKLRHVAILDRAAAKLPAREAMLEIPVGVGFCMLITRKLLNQIGALDGTSIFRGYGEEVDFCLRGAEAGLKNYGLFNVFVGHLGERSFGVGKKALAAQNNEAIFEKFPKYNKEYEIFLFTAKPRKLRERLAKFSLQDLKKLPILEIRPWSCRYLPPWVKDGQFKPKRQGAALFLQPGTNPRALLRIWAEFPVMEMTFDLPAQKYELVEIMAKLEFDKKLLFGNSKGIINLAKDLGLIFEQAKSGDKPEAWQGQGEILLAAPPQSLGAFKRLCQIAKKFGGKKFYCFHIDSLWSGAPKPGNILEMPRMEDYSLPGPEAFLMMDNYVDLPNWRQWLAAHNCGHLPAYAVEAV